MHEAARAAADEALLPLLEEQQLLHVLLRAAPTLWNSDGVVNAAARHVVPKYLAVVAAGCDNWRDAVALREQRSAEDVVRVPLQRQHRLDFPSPLVGPDNHFLVPADAQDVLEPVLVDVCNSRYLLGTVINELVKTMPVTEVPYAHDPVMVSGYKTATTGVEEHARDLGARSLWVKVVKDQPARFQVPHSGFRVLVDAHHLVEDIVVARSDDRRLVRRVHSLRHQPLQLPALEARGAGEKTTAVGVKGNRTEAVRRLGEALPEGLEAAVRAHVPDLHHSVRAETHELVEH
mmetsp:Transcript_13521/g.31114  ORF Transcript_13521/g.31114 Transcript_13521/m.31114 type:complete len:290 (-) Transcript_13521:1403-2272(-)